MIVAVPCGQDEARALLAPILTCRTDREGRFCLSDVIGQGAAYRVMDKGATVGAFVLQPYDRVLWITAAAGRARCDLVNEITRLATSEAGGCFQHLGFRTERPGLVRKACKAGYQVTRREGPAYFLRKQIA